MATSTFHSTRPPLLARLGRKIDDTLEAAGRRPVRLDEDEILTTAMKRAGLSDFGEGEFREPFGLLVRSLQEDGEQTLLGRIWFREFCLGHLVARLQIADTLKKQPEIRQVPLTRPLFILGLPRTGSTLLHNLLAEDSEVRSPRAWEMNNPCPPPKPEASLADRGRMAQAHLLLKVFDYLSPGFLVGHYMHPSRPDECAFLLMKTFLDLHFGLTFGAYTYYDWFVEQDMTAAYEYYRTALQLMSLNFPGKRLVLKYPYHAFYLPILHRLFPDALFVQTHRDPCKSIPSIATLVALGQRATRKQVDLPRLGRLLLDYNSRAVLNALEARQNVPASQYHDVHYQDLLRDPMAAVQGIYDAFGYELSAEARRRMEAYLAKNPQHKLGVFRYNMADFELDPETIRRATARYCEAHGIQPEP